MRGQPNPDQMSGMHGLPVPRNQPSTMPPSGAPTFTSESVPYPTQLPTRTPLPPPPPPHPAPPSTGLQLRPSSNTAKDVARSNFTKECEMYRLILLGMLFCRVAAIYLPLPPCSQHATPSSTSCD